MSESDLKFWAEVTVTTEYPKAVGYRPNINYLDYDDGEIFSVAVFEMDGTTWGFLCYIAPSVERVHRLRLKPGVRLSIQEGPHVKGLAVVTKVEEGRISF